MSPLDLHVLGTPPAFVLSQDQTLPFNPFTLGIRCLSFLRFGYSCIVFKVQRSPLSQSACVSYHEAPLLSSAFFEISGRIFILKLVFVLFSLQSTYFIHNITTFFLLFGYNHISSGLIFLFSFGRNYAIMSPMCPAGPEPTASRGKEGEFFD